MYDPQSRLLVVRRMHDERLAEARRTHLLRTDRGDVRTHSARDFVTAPRAVLGRVGAAFHGATGPIPAHRNAVR